MYKWNDRKMVYADGLMAIVDDVPVCYQNVERQ